jgi:hypothetical protein
LKLSYDGGDSDSNKCKPGYSGACGGVQQSAFVESLESAVGFVLVRLAGIRCREDVFTFKTFYKLCTFNAICKDTAAIYYITVQRRKGSFVSSLTGIVA